LVFDGAPAKSSQRLGKGGAKRRRNVISDYIQGIRRLARRGGVNEETRGILGKRYS
jgi:hypothetical protein